MRIFYDKQKTEELTQRIIDNFDRENKKSTRGTEVHVSDLIGCQVAAYNRITGVPANKTKSSKGLMAFGIASELVLALTYDEEERQKESRLFLKEDESIFGHIDIFESLMYPLEVKNSRLRVFKASDIPQKWVEQLMAYMSIEGATTGWIVVFNAVSTQLIAFRLEMTKDDILGWLSTLTTRTHNILVAVNSDRNPFKLEVDGKNYSMCYYKKDCKRVQECKKKYYEIRKAKNASK